MRIAFQKNGTSWFAKVIQWWTKSIYYHCEIIFEDKTSFTANIDKNGYGTYFHTFDYNNYDKSNWDLIDINITSEQESQIKEWCKNEDGCWYDIIGLFLTQVIPLSFENSRWWFCSEMVIAALKENLGWFGTTKPHEIDPSEAYKMIQDKIKERNLFSELYSQIDKT